MFLPGFAEAIEKEAVQLYRHYGILPSELWDQTPHDLYAVMFNRAAKGNVNTTLPPLEGLTKVNAMRAKKGLPPVTGGMFKDVLKEVPNARRQR